MKEFWKKNFEKLREKIEEISGRKIQIKSRKKI